MKTEIIRQLNQQNTLDNMIPLTKFSSESELQELEKRGYNAGYTAESWKAEFPEIDPKYILCPQTVIFPASLIYYDPEHYICFNTYIYGGKILYPGEKGKPQDDKLIIEVSKDASLDAICEQMGRTPPWLLGIELRADGYECQFYQKA